MQIYNNQYKDSINFFNNLASEWDSHYTKKDYEVINKIFSRSKININDKILDVASGTGIFTGVLLKNGIKDIVGIDISNKMIDLFRAKYPHLLSINDSFENYNFNDMKFDKIIIFNSFPHFKEPQLVFTKSFELLKNTGRLIVAHTMNRDDLNEHHRNAGRIVEKDVLISNDLFYQYYSSNGFHEVEIENYNYFYSSAIVLKI
ncbi:MAG: class I SAM-dependent methyltransferase [Oligoflexia bacterium]|nr:class I SAM-dependent methyltransferase [Oligoflexia bacterium]